jgi:hypothetical protein
MHMNRFGYRCAVLTLLAPLLLAATSGAKEHLAAPALPGFVVGYEAANAEQSIREEVPAGETVQKWTRMVTTQWYAGATKRLTPTQFLQNVAAGLAQACPKAMTTKPVLATRSGRPSAQFRVDCPLLASTGKPEAFIMLAISGPADLHVKQVAFRRVLSAADVSWAETFLAAVTLN